MERRTRSMRTRQEEEAVSWATKIENSRGDHAYLVRGKDNGRPAWHYVLVNPLKLTEFEKALATGNLDVADYGKVLHSGWGDDPPDELARRIKDQFS